MDGDYKFQAVVTDPAGNSSTSNVIEVIVDNTAPTVPTISAVSENVAPVTGMLTSGASTNDPDLTVKVGLPTTGSLAVAGNTVQLFNGAAALGAAHVLTSGEVNAGFVSLQTGMLVGGTTYDITAKLTDAAGNFSNANKFTVIEDDTAPSAPTDQHSHRRCRAGDRDANQRYHHQRH